MDSSGSAVGGVILLLFLFGMYMLPTIIAAARRHRQTGAIGALNLLLGWTVLGWVGAFVWSLTSPPAPQTIIVHSNGTPPVVPQ